MLFQPLGSGADLSLHVPPLLPGPVGAEEGGLASGHTLTLARLGRGVHLDPGGGSLVPPTDHAPCWIRSGPSSEVEGRGTRALVGGNYPSGSAKNGKLEKEYNSG